MEEYVGGLWHKFITRRASQDFPESRVCLREVSRSVALLYRALGGESGLRIEETAPRDYLTWRTLLARIAGSGNKASLAWRDNESLRLPAALSLFPDKILNYELYLWLAALAAYQPETFRHWGVDNQQYVVDLLQQCPGLRSRYQQLVQAYLRLRPEPEHLPEPDVALENSIRQALLEPGSVTSFPVCNRAPWPVVLWLYPAFSQDKPLQMLSEETDSAEPSHEIGSASKRNRKKGEVVDDPNGKSGMLIFRLENLFSWTEYSELDRTVDDSEDEDAGSIADDLNVISVSRKRQASASRLKLDLDLPAAINDDLPLGEGILLPE